MIIVIIIYLFEIVTKTKNDSMWLSSNKNVLSLRYN